MAKINNAPVIKKTKKVTELNEKIVLERKQTELEKKADKLKAENTPKKKVKLSIEDKIDASILKLRTAWQTHIEVWALKSIILGIIK